MLKMFRLCRPHIIFNTSRHITCTPRVANLKWPTPALRHLASTPSIAPKRKTMFPERLLIYHAGTGRTVFLGCQKVTTIFICAAFSLIFAPAHFMSDDQPDWVAGAVLLSGVIPMLTIAYMTAPFVTYIHLRLPPFARNSKEMLLRYSKHVSKDAELDITTMNFIGKPRVARVKVADLYPVRMRFGLANYKRDTEQIDKKRKWWMGKAVALFGVHTTKSNVRESVVWENVKKSLAKNRKK